MARQQINIKLPPELIEALREKASMREITLTELIQGFCEQGLGLPASNHQPVDTALIYERILSEVDTHITAQLDVRIPELEEPLLNQIEDRIAVIIDARISSQITLLEQRLSTQPGNSKLQHDVSELLKRLAASEECQQELRSMLDDQAPYAEQQIKQLQQSRPAQPLEESAIVEEISTPSSTSSLEGEAKLVQEHKLEALSSPKLEKRLGVSNGTISKNKDLGNEHFRKWSAERDRDGVAWEYREGASPRFHPLV